MPTRHFHTNEHCGHWWCRSEALCCLAHPYFKLVSRTHLNTALGLSLYLLSPFSHVVAFQSCTLRIRLASCGNSCWVTMYSISNHQRCLSPNHKPALNTKEFNSTAHKSIQKFRLAGHHCTQSAAAFSLPFRKLTSLKATPQNHTTAVCLLGVTSTKCP
jgi:hypothetical protein